MKKERKKALQRVIAQLENPYPDDNMISSYHDFLKVRHYLRFFQFNPIVFDNLLRITIEAWESKKRVNRLALVITLKQYFKRTIQESINEDNSKNRIIKFPLSPDTKKMLFNLFKLTIKEGKRISEKQLPKAIAVCNNMFISMELSETEQEWLCSNASVSETVLNRVLRYPVKSDIISSWAKNNFQNNSFRNRRAEIIGWVLDQEPNFEVEKQTIIDDFNYLHKSDLEAVRRYDDEIIANKIIEREFRDFLPKKKQQSFDYSEGIFRDDEVIGLSEPELKLSSRIYPVPYKDLKKYPGGIPDFEKLRQRFFSGVEKIHKLTMISAIGYSRLDNDTKSALLKKYYFKATWDLLFRISKKNKNLSFLKWLLEQEK